MHDRRVAIDLRLLGRKARMRPAKSNTARGPRSAAATARQGIPGRGGTGEFGVAQAEANRSGFRARRASSRARTRRVAHIAMPVFAGTTDADRLAILGDVGDYDDLRAAGHAPPFAEDVELDLAKAAGEGNLLGRRDVLAAKEDHAILVVSPLDCGKRGVIMGSGEIDPADLGARAAPVGTISIDIGLLDARYLAAVASCGERAAGTGRAPVPACVELRVIAAVEYSVPFTKTLCTPIGSRIVRGPPPGRSLTRRAAEMPTMAGSNNSSRHRRRRRSGRDRNAVEPAW